MIVLRLGNHTPAAEFNFFFDPEAAFITLQAYSKKCSVYLVPFEYTLDFPLSYERYEKWLACGNPSKVAFAKVRL